MESKPKLQPFYFKVWRGTKISEEGARIIKPLTLKNQEMIKQAQELYSRGITTERYKQLTSERAALCNKVKELRDIHEEPISWCVCFMANTREGAEARLIRCVFGGSLGVEFNGYAKTTREVYEASLNPEKDSEAVHLLVKH